MRVTKKEYGLGIARMIAHLERTPSTTNELIRICNLHPQVAASMLYYLRNKKVVDYVEVDEAVTTDSDIAEEGRYYKFKIWYYIKRYDEKLIEKRKRELIKMSQIGNEVTKMFENAIYEACHYVFGDANIEKTPFNDPRNDVYVHRYNLAFDMVTHYENPLRSIYLVKKHSYLPLGYKWHVISSCGWILDDAYRYAWKHNIELHSLGINEGFPIFKKHERFIKLFERSGRNVQVVNYYDVLHDLESMLERIKRRLK